MGRAAWMGIFLWMSSVQAEARPLCRMELPLLRGDRIELLATRVSLEGQIQGQVDWKLEVPGGRREIAPLRQRLWRTEEPLLLAILVEASVAYQPATDAVRGALQRFLQAMPPATQGVLWRFASDSEGLAGFRPVRALAAEAGRFNAAIEGEIRLLGAIRRAQIQLIREAGGRRRALVVLADGRNSVMDPGAFYVAGRDLGEDEVPIYALGFSPRDERGPLRNLGDLAKRTGGTFRWARSTDELEPQLLSLADELKGAQQLLFDATALGLGAEAELPRLRLRCSDGASNECRLRRGPRSDWPLLPPVIGGAICALAGYWLLRRRGKGTDAPAPAARSALPVPWVAASQTVFMPPPDPRPEPDRRVKAGPTLVAQDGRAVELGARLEIGVGLAGPGTLSLLPGTRRVLCVIVYEGGQHRLLAQGSGVHLNGRRLIGEMRLRDGDRFSVGAGGAWTMKL